MPAPSPRDRGTAAALVLVTILFQILSDLFFVAKRDKKWWLLPLMVLLLILGALLTFAMALGPIAPFVYPLL